MTEWIRYRFLMRRLRGEIARFVDRDRKQTKKQNAEKEKRAVVTACKACGSIV
jgi:hypothetical protein